MKISFHKRIIFQVLLATIPFLIAGLVVSFNILSQNFARINNLHLDTRKVFETDIVALENQLLELKDENNRLKAKQIGFEQEKITASTRDEFYKKAYELRGEKVALASSLTIKAVTEISDRAEISAASVHKRLESIFDDLAIDVIYWKNNQPLKRLLPYKNISTDFSEYALEALQQNKSDWFEDQLGNKDVLISLVPYRKEGLFIFTFDLSKAYSYFDQAERTKLNQATVIQQEKRFLDAKQQERDFLAQRESQARLVKHQSQQRNEIFNQVKNNLILFTAANILALIVTSLLLFWYLGTRKITTLSNWLMETSAHIRNPENSNATPGDNSNSSIPLANGFNRHFVDRSSNEVGELSRNINFMLEALQQSTVSKVTLQQEIDSKERLASELLEQKKRRDLIFSTVQSGVLMIDSATRKIIDINPAALELFQGEKEAIVGCSCDLFFLQDLSSEEDHCESKYETTLNPLSGQALAVLKTDRIVKLDGRDVIISSFVNFEDIKNSRDQLEQAKTEAEQASRMKSEFLANMSHEIRTPLNGVIGMTQLLTESKMTTDQERICQTIMAEADSLLRIINEILDLSKIEAGKVDLEVIPFNLRTVVEQTTENLALRMPQKGIEALSFIPPEIPEAVLGDSGRLQQVLNNLGQNALKFTSKGQIYLSLTRFDGPDERLWIRFAVEDTGIGIPADKQQQIFESFTQADGSTTRKYGGTGLGTTISKQLVELMGGEIGLSSVEGEGSTFWFTLPFEPAPAVDNDEAFLDLSKKHVLVIDDNPTNRIILNRYLESYGCRVSLSSDAAASLKQLPRTEGYDLIISDFNMPGMNGQEFVEHLRKLDDPKLNKIPVIILSSHHTINYLKTSGDLSIQGLLRKPVRKDDLYSVLQTAFSIDVRSTPFVEETEKASSDDQFHNRAQKLILLAEDYPTNQQIALRYLTNAGYKVDIAENGVQAVEAFKTHDYDLILMDIQMPEMDGYEATRLIREFEKDKDAKTLILAMTAHASTGYREKCLASDMNDYISKPIRKESFIDKVDSLLMDDHQPTDEFSESAAIHNADIFDDQKALKAFLDDNDFLYEVVDGFQNNLETQLPLIKQAVSDGNLESVSREAHSIKGGAYNLYANRIAQSAALLEKAGKDNNPEECKSCLDSLFESVTAFNDYIASNKPHLKDETS